MYQDSTYVEIRDQPIEVSIVDGNGALAVPFDPCDLESMSAADLMALRDFTRRDADYESLNMNDDEAEANRAIVGELIRRIEVIAEQHRNKNER